tara:strand:+ start:41 stop:373 length:333 start_codon:yes stop_codon:yes gene_type:complete
MDDGYFIFATHGFYDYCYPLPRNENSFKQMITDNENRIKETYEMRIFNLQNEITTIQNSKKKEKTKKKLIEDVEYYVNMKHIDIKILENQIDEIHGIINKIFKENESDDE